ncbi:MAG: UDP-N-acetylglucosamine 2-epimerase (non-hydrolyzing) [Flavobacteriaceae bacterium]|nr:UDP-N-acetylglucosamine 2-epimerase (non-hydrolyzing) [Flavobacteriaceae bacterium]
MKRKLKVVTVVGTRPEIIRLSAIIKRLNNSNSIDHCLIHTGQNYDKELNQIFFDDLNINSPDYYLKAALGNPILTISNILNSLQPLLEKINPDAFLVLGDTNSCLSAIVAKKMKIPVFHYEAGNRCFDQRVPEETNRKIVDIISDINLTYSKISKDYLISEGFPADQIIKIGSPMREVLNQNMGKINSSSILKDLNLEKDKYFVVSFHREENIDSTNFNEFLTTLNNLGDIYKLPIIFSTHPRTLKKLESQKIKSSKLITFLPPLSFSDYNCLQINSLVTLSDSGTISEESSILKFRALNIRDSHERPEAMEESSVIMTGTNSERIIQSIELIKDQNMDEILMDVSDYKPYNISIKVERIILSYTDYINKKVWRKES